MNTYRYNDLKIGHTETYEHVISEKDMKHFLEITGDINPLHNDVEYAIEHGFNEKVVYGMLTASLISTFAGVYLPGKYCLIQQIEVKFISPVFIGDILTIKGSIKEMNDSVQQVVIKFEIKNHLDKKVVRGNLNVGFLE